jgi:rsbT co-antagonist protein RsbR
MNNSINQKTNEQLRKSKEIVVKKWNENVYKKSLIKRNLYSENEIIDICNKIVNSFLTMIEFEGEITLGLSELNNVKRVLEEYSKITVSRGLTQMEVSTFIFSLKSIVFDMLSDIDYEDNASLSKETIRMSEVLDKMGLFTFDLYAKEREEIVIRQQEDMIELSTPVIQIWDGILAVPLIGTLDSKRTQMVMEKLLDMIVATSSKIAIIDITGIPTVDTLVANHLLKTASATRLLGAELIITGISPVIAQTMVHLGVDLSGVITRAVMADGIKLAMEMTEFKVVKITK